MNCLGASRLKISWLRTFFCKALHGGHQSDPVNSIRISLFSLAASSLASAKSTSQPSPAAEARLGDKATSVILVVSDQDTSDRIGFMLYLL